MKLSALLDLVTLTLPDDGRRYYAPWRTDPRPTGSLLQGAYAFLGVSDFWRQRRRTADEATRQRADTEFVRWRPASGRVVHTLLNSGQLTPAGQHFAGQMRRVLEACQREPVQAKAVAEARRDAERHLVRWQAESGIVSG